MLFTNASIENNLLAGLRCGADWPVTKWVIHTVLPWRMMRCAVLPPFVFPVPCLPVQGKDEVSPWCAAHPVGPPQAEHRRAVQQREGPGQGMGKDGKQDHLWGWPRLSTCPPGGSGVVSHHPGHHVFPHLVTRELSSSWTANTSLQWAFQEEVARSDLGGTRPKGGNVCWLLGISVLRTRPVFRTDVPRSQHKRQVAIESAIILRDAVPHGPWSHHA